METVSESKLWKQLEWVLIRDVLSYNNSGMLIVSLVGVWMWTICLYLDHTRCNLSRA